MIDSVSDHDIDNFVINVEDCSAMNNPSPNRWDRYAFETEGKGAGYNL